MKWIPVSARGLHRRTIRANDSVLDNGTMFPFFDCDGQVSSLMVTALESLDIWLMPWAAELVIVPPFGAIQLRTNLASHRAARPSDAGSALATWHYDPWWLLAADQFSDRREFVAALKATNAVNRMTVDVRQLWFARDLSRVRFVVTGRGLTGASSRWRSNLLLATRPSPPVRGQPTAERQPRGFWQCDPIWSHWSQGSRDDRIAGWDAGGVLWSICVEVRWIFDIRAHRDGGLSNWELCNDQTCARVRCQPTRSAARSVTARRAEHEALPAYSRQWHVGSSQLSRIPPTELHGVFLS